MDSILVNKIKKNCNWVIYTKYNFIKKEKNGSVLSRDKRVQRSIKGCKYVIFSVVNALIHKGQGDLKPVSIHVQFVSYQCKHRHKLLIGQCQINGHDLSFYVSMRTSYQFQQGHKPAISNLPNMHDELGNTPGNKTLAFSAEIEPDLSEIYFSCDF